MKKMIAGFLIATMGILFSGCSGSSNSDALSSTKAITAFGFTSPAAVGVVAEATHSIAVTVPFGTDVTTLIPTIIHTGANVSPASGVAQDFTSPVVYTVTAADATTQDYTVTVTVAPSTAKAITAFSFTNPAVVGVVAEATHSIAVTVPFGTDVTTLIPTIIHTGANVSPASGVAQDFTSPVVYTVTAADAATQDYTVTVTVALNDAKAITAFDFANPAAVGVITEATHSISVTVPFGTDVTALIPTISHTGANVSPASGVAQDFTSPVVYTVTAENSSTQDYTVTVAPWTNCGDVLTHGGELYPTVLINTQCWFAKNLNIGTMTVTLGQGTSCASIQKYCYDDDENNCTTYGGLYTWTQAMCGSVTEGAQGICPTGWHIPSDPEYVALTNYLGSAACATYRTGNNNYCGAPAGDRMKAAGLCEGRTPCGDSGFNGLLGGQAGSDKTFIGMGVYTIFWTSSDHSSTSEAWRSGLAIDQSGVDSTYFYSSYAAARAIRCLKD
jgi:uncharacterized protein (TIGR02145 family)